MNESSSIINKLHVDKKLYNNRYKEDLLWTNNKDLKRNNSIFTSTFLAVIIRNDE